MLFTFTNNPVVSRTKSILYDPLSPLLRNKRGNLSEVQTREIVVMEEWLWMYSGVFVRQKVDLSD